MVGLPVPPLLLLPAILVALPFQVLARAGHLMRREGKEAEGGGSMSVAPDGKVAEVMIPDGKVADPSKSDSYMQNPSGGRSAAEVSPHGLASKSESYMQNSSDGRNATEVSPHGAPDGADLLRQHGLQANAGEGGKAWAKLHPCPMVSALIANGKVVLGPKGEWSDDQAYRILDAYFRAAGWAAGKREAYKHGLVKGFFGTSSEVTVPEWEADKKHTTYTGIRLPKIRGQPDYFQGACNAHAFMRKDPDCGKPGPHPAVFDALARALGKSSPGATWTSEDTAKICPKAEELFFELPASCSRDSGKSAKWSYWRHRFSACPSPYKASYESESWGKCLCPPHECHEGAGCKAMAYQRGPWYKSVCGGVYGVLSELYGEITTAELKAFLTEDKFPAVFADKVKNFAVMRYQ